MALPSSQYSVSTEILDSDFLPFAHIEDEAFKYSRLKNLIFYPPASTNPLPSTSTSTSTALKSEPSPTSNNSPQIDPLTWRSDELRTLHNDDVTAHFTKATNIVTAASATSSPAEPIGFAKWNLFLPPHAGVQPREHAVYPPGANEALGEHFSDTLRAARTAHMGDRAHFMLSILAVAPAHQRRGVGALLLERVLALADAKAVPCWVDASPQGKGLYEKLGWKEVGRFKVDLGAWGGKEGTFSVNVHMVREPQGGETVGV